MIAIAVPADFWSSSMLPQGILEKWLMADGTFVEAGEAVACVRVEDALHELMAPSEGWLTVDRPVNAVVEPGAIVGHIGKP